MTFFIYLTCNVQTCNVAIQNTNLQNLKSSQHGNCFMVSQPQSTTVEAVLNGAPGKRVRACRGQATDPYSIAERVRKCSYLKHCYSKCVCT
jgi:hypothetical protein